MKLLGAALAALSLLPSSRTAAQAITPAQIIAIRKAYSPLISPDGTTCVYGIYEMPDSTSSVELSTWWKRRIVSAEPAQPISFIGNDDYAVSYVPTTNLLSFISDRTGTAQVFVGDQDAKEARQVTAARDGISKYIFSQDGKHIAYLSGSPARISIADVATGESSQLSTDVDLRDLAWSPDGREFAAIIRQAAGPVDRLALVVLDAKTGQVTRRLADKVNSLTRPLRWSPDGKWITYVQNTASEGAGWLAAASAQGGKTVDILKNYPGTFMQVEWLRRPDQLALIMLKGLESYLMYYDVRTATMLDSTRIITSQSSWGLSSNGERIVFLAETAKSPPDVWFSDSRRPPVQLTHLNAQVASWPLGEVRTLEWRNRVDGERMDGVLILPHDYVAGRRYPTIVHMHPGDLPWWPGFIGSWFAWGQLLASHGYVVFLPNYRGVNAYGVKRRETLNDWGGAALQDMLDGVDKLVADGIADSSRLGIGGWSNGGFMTEWTITHTNRFKAAVAEAAHADFFSLYGTSRGERPSFGVSPYIDRSAYDSHSPITYVKNVRTPTLLIHGEKDSGVPVTQSYEFHRALQELGVETELLVIPGEGHGISEPVNRVKVQSRMLDWFDRHLKSDRQNAGRP